MPHIVEQLSKNSQTLLEQAHSNWQLHDSHFRPQLQNLLTFVFSAASIHQENVAGLPDFPEPLREYRKLASTLISAIILFSQDESLHPDLYKFCHALGQMKDVYYTGLLSTYQDSDSYRKTVEDTDITFQNEHKSVASNETILARIQTKIEQIKNLLLQGTLIPLHEMHQMRKELRGFVFLLKIKQQLDSDDHNSKFTSKLQRIIDHLGDIHDSYVMALTEDTTNTIEFTQEYMKIHVELPEKMTRKILELIST